MSKDTTFSPISIVCRKKLHTFSRPAVMGILNITPDSFYDGGRYVNLESILARAEQIITEGADIIDIGASSSRPGAQLVEPNEEAARLVPVIKMIRERFPDSIISVDTCYSIPAERSIEAGADIINDISGGQFDDRMIPLVAEMGVPYILMHTQGKPDHMQDNPHYDNILQEVALYFSQRLERLYRLGARDVILDPGFGFAKTLDDNYQLFSQLPELKQLFPNEPLLVAVSRKSMIYKLDGTTPQDAMPGTLVLGSEALRMGAQLLRVHDVKETVQTINVLQKLWNC